MTKKHFVFCVRVTVKDVSNVGWKHSQTDGGCKILPVRVCNPISIFQTEIACNDADFMEHISHPLHEKHDAILLFFSKSIYDLHSWLIYLWKRSKRNGSWGSFLL